MVRFDFNLLLFSLILVIVRGAWFQTTVPVRNVDYVSAAFSSPTVCVMVGYNTFGGSIIRTANSGFNWTVVSNDLTQTSDISTVTLSSATYYLVVSLAGTVYLSSNRGSNFTVVATLPSQLFGVGIGSNGNAYAVGIPTGSGASSTVYSSNYTGSGYVNWVDISPAAKVISEDIVIYVAVELSCMTSNCCP